VQLTLLCNLVHKCQYRVHAYVYGNFVGVLGSWLVASAVLEHLQADLCHAGMRCASARWGWHGQVLLVQVSLFHEAHYVPQQHGAVCSLVHTQVCS
jgi:hypothetical protein